MQKVFAVRDVKAEAYGNLICAPTKGIAVRAFTNACVENGSPMGRYPEDYMLYELGSYDPNSGLLVALSNPAFIVSASEAISQAVKDQAKPESKVEEAVQ